MCSTLGGEMAGFDGVVLAIQKGIPNLAETCLHGFVEEAKTNVSNLLESSKNDLKSWLEALTTKQLSLNDFNSLVKTKCALAEMDALKEKGIAEIQLQNFRNGVINLIVTSVMNAIP